MAFLNYFSSTALALLSFTGLALCCSTGNFVPASNANALYYVDTASLARLTFETYFFGTDCTQQLQVVLQGPDGATTQCDPVTEPGDSQTAWVTCQAMSSFVNGQYEILFYGNVQQYNQFQVTTSQATITVTPTATVTDTPTVWQTQTSTETDTETDTVTPAAVTLPATVKTVTRHPHKVTTTTTVTKTKTRTKLRYTVVPTLITVPPKCDHSYPSRCSSIKGKSHPHARFPTLGEHELGVAAIADVVPEKRSNDLVKRCDDVSTLQDPTTTSTLTTGLPTIVVEAAPVTSTETDTIYTTSTVFTTLAPETVYTGKSVVVITAPTPTKTVTQHTVITTAVTKTKTITFKITETTKPSYAQITSCIKAGGHY